MSKTTDKQSSILFPPIIKEQFIQGTKEYIPLYHDGVKLQESSNIIADVELEIFPMKKV